MKKIKFAEIGVITIMFLLSGFLNDINTQTFEMERPPAAVNLVQISASMDYPQDALLAGIEGKVRVRVLVDTDGRVIKAGDITGPEIFYQEVLSKVNLLQFMPRLHEGKAVKVWVTVPFSFELSD